MSMYNPPHPGEFIEATYMEPFELSCRFLATKLDVSASTLNRIIKQKSNVSPEMALRLSKALGRSPESWLAMQDAFNLWKVRKQVKLGRVRSVKLEEHVCA
jgi:addiction module HigA family antidote